MTDGVYNDRQKTINAIVEASGLPLSIIIVGIGAADFERMEELDADEVPLVHSNGQKMARDAVQFVPMRDFATLSPSALVSSVLAEMPGQIEEYFAMHNITPPPPPSAPAIGAAASSALPPFAPGSVQEAAASIQLDDDSSESLPPYE